MTKQDERLRVRKRLIERAIEHASNYNWQDAISDNMRLLEMGADAETYNRLGKAHLELGQFDKALEYYNETLNLNRSNTVAIRNVTRLTQLQGVTGSESKERMNADPSIFIVETGKTALTTLTRLGDGRALIQLVISEQLHIKDDGNDVWLETPDGSVVGFFEPVLARRLLELQSGGNRYTAVIANLDNGKVKVLVREVFQSPEQRSLVSFPGKLGGDIAAFRTYNRDLTTQYDLESDDLGDDEIVEEDVSDDAEDDFFRGGSDTEEEVGLEAIEADINADDDDEEN